MKRKVWRVTAATFLVFVLISIAAMFLVGRGTDRWILMLGLMLLGLVAAGLVYLVMASRSQQQGATGAAATGGDVVDAAVAAARNRLGGAGRMGGSPMVVVMGPTGSAKTTIVAESGLA